MPGRLPRRLGDRLRALVAGALRDRHHAGAFPRASRLAAARWASSPSPASSRSWSRSLSTSSRPHSGSTGSPSILTFDGSAYLAFLVVGLIYVPEWGKVPLIGKIAIPLAALALAITFPYWSSHMFTIPIFGEFPSVETGVVMLVFIMMAVGLNIVVGYAGLLDLGYVAFYAMGAYTAAWLASQFAGAKCPRAGFGIDNCLRPSPRSTDFGGVGVTPGIGGIHVSIWLILAARRPVDRADRRGHRPADAAPARRLPGDRHARLRRDPAPDRPQRERPRRLQPDGRAARDHAGRLARLRQPSADWTGDSCPRTT